MIQIIINTYKEIKVRIISGLYKKLISNKHSTKYIKEKWESEFKIKITDEEWLNMWKTHENHTSTSSRIWREFSWKNLIRFFISPKVKSKQLNKNIPCWRDCGVMNVDHSQIFWKCDKIRRFWKMLYNALLNILGHKSPMSCTVLYLCNLSDENIRGKDRYLVKVLLTAAKKAITKKWGRGDIPTQDQWTHLVEEIYTLEKMIHRLRLQEAQFNEKWSKWTIYMTDQRQNTKLN